MAAKNFRFEEKESGGNKIRVCDRVTTKIKAYEEAGELLDKNITMRYEMQVIDYQESHFEVAAKKRPDTLKTTVGAVYRIKTKNGEEYYMYNAQKTCMGDNDKQLFFDFDGYGYHRHPIVAWKYSSSKQEKVPSVVGFSHGYESKWSKEDVKKLLDKSEIPCEQFYVCREGVLSEPTSDTKYTINNVQDFLEGNFEDLWDLGRLGISYKEPSLYLIEAARKQERQNRETSLGMRIGPQYT